MTLAAGKGVMAAVSRIRWQLTLYLLELMLRGLLLIAIFKRPTLTPTAARPASAPPSPRRRLPLRESEPAR